jgi:hypothetical protein
VSGAVLSDIKLGVLLLALASLKGLASIGTSVLQWLPVSELSGPTCDLAPKKLCGLQDMHEQN